MKKIIGLVALLSCMFFADFEAVASHVSGGNIRYNYIGPTAGRPGYHSYRVRLGILRDCNGATYTQAQHQLTAVCKPSNTPDIRFAVRKHNYVPKPGEPANARNNRDVSDVCRGIKSQCEDRNNRVGGYEEVIYYGTVDLPACNYWEIYLNRSVCCRNNTVNSNGLYYSPMTRLNSANFPKNTSPNFADEVKPMPSVCTGQDVFYGIGTVDPDGDSLRFRLVPGRSTATNTSVTNVTYRSPYTFQRPIPGLTLDSASGLISFKTNTTGKFLVAFEVIEYERCTGREKGRTHREVQFDVRACTNNVPRDITGITNLKGNAKKLGKYTLEVCEGEVISWQDTIYDKDAQDTLYFASNVDSVLSSIKWKVIRIPGQSNKAVVQYDWRARIKEGQYHTFFLSFDDDRCNYPGNGFSVFNVFVRPAASAGPDQHICLGDTAHLDALGGTSFKWHFISGDPMVNGVNWFPDTTTTDTNRTARFIPTRTTKLWVEVDTLRDQCGNLTVANCFTTDTITINVLDSFSIKTLPDFFLCNPGKGQLDVTPSQPFNYTYKWAPSSFLDYDTLKNPNFTGVKHPETFDVTVTSDSGCVREGSINVNVTDPFPENMRALASDTLVCLQKQIDLWVDKGSIDYGGCDTVTYRCQGNFQDFTKGAGAIRNTSTNAGFAYSYGTRNISQKSQYLYLASDLKAMGMQAGPIKSIAWELATLNGAAPVNGFRIAVGCTNLDEMPLNTFISGLRTVFNPRSIFVNAGWNTHTFDVEYVWDGKSNIVVEVCFQNTSGSGLHHVQTFDNTTYPSASSYYQTSTFQGSACGNTGLSGGFPNRTLPRTRFNSCIGMRSSLFKYTWAPTSNGGFVGATNRDSALAAVNLTTAKKYFVYVEDSAYGVCKDTLEVGVNVVASYDVTPDSIGPRCLTSGFIQLTSPTPPNISNPGGKWSGAGIINDSLGVWDPSKSGPGKFWVTYSVTGDACAAKDSIEIEVVGLPDLTLLSPDSLCGIYGGGILPDTIRHRLVPKNSGGWFTGYGVDSIANSNGEMVYWVDGTKFNPTKGNPDTARITYTMVAGCKDDSTFKIPVVAPWDHTYQGVLVNGVPTQTINFCATSDPDTLSVAGDNPLWYYSQDTAAMIDKSLGILDPRIAAQGKDRDFTGTIWVGNKGFCGTDTTVAIRFILAPEIEVVSRSYCPNDILAMDPRDQDTVMLRIPKGDAFGGSGLKKLGGANNDTLAMNGHTINAGWTKASSNFTLNGWSGAGITSLAAIYRPYGLNDGATVFSYRFAMEYRDSKFPNERRHCYSVDSGTVFKIKDIDHPVGNTLKFCDEDTVSGFTINENPKYGNEYSLVWYLDDQGTEIDTVGVKDTLYHDSRMNTGVGTHNLYVRYLHNASGCISYKKGAAFGTVPYNVLAYPEVSFTSDPEDLGSQFAPSSVGYTNTTEYTEGGMKYKWKFYHGNSYAGTDGNSIKINSTPNNSTEFVETDPLQSIRVNYVEAVPKANPSSPDPLIIQLWGVNEIGCADSTRISFEIGTEVQFVWPNVFTPGVDGVNDWWFIVPPEGTEAYSCTGSECFTQGGEEGIKQWFDLNLDTFEGYIFDRWGRKVYTLTKEEPVWKGLSTSGGKLTDGVYMYSIRYKSKGSSAEEKRQEGTITLIREK